MGLGEWFYGQPGFAIHKDDPGHMLAQSILTSAGFANKPGAFNEAIHGLGVFIE